MKETPSLYPPEMDHYEDWYYASELLMPFVVLVKPEPTETTVLFDSEKQNQEPTKEKKE